MVSVAGPEGTSRPATVLMTLADTDRRGSINNGRGGSVPGKHLVPTHRAKCPQAVSKRLVSWRSVGKDVDSMRSA